MYVRSKTPKYVCHKCKNKIPIVDLEAIFHEELQAFFTQTDKIAAQLLKTDETLKEKEKVISAHERAIQKIRDEMTQTHRLYIAGQITAQGFGQFYKPAEERLNQLMKELPRLQSEIDYLKVNQLSADAVVKEATSLYDRWPKLPTDEKRKIAENLCQKIIVGKDEIDITLSYLPTSEDMYKANSGINCRFKV